jgi:hypothetical protein
MVSLNFKDSAIFTAERKGKIEREFNEAYYFLKRVGIDGPTTFPMIGVDPRKTG